MLLYHIIGFFMGFLLDIIFGDPYCLPHPIRLIGNVIILLEKKLINWDRKMAGKILVITVLLGTGIVSGGILYISYRINAIAGIIAESIMTYYILAMKCLRDESMKVYRKLKEDDLQGAKNAVSMIVGRDVEYLDPAGVTKAAVETVAENISDGVIAPMIYLAIGGPVLGFLYKAINTMDSMVGYKNDKYMDFGKAAAKLDDMVNFIPSRISAVLMIVSSYLCGKEFDARQALLIFKRDRLKHVSPNSAQTEAVCAGALGIQLLGDAYYFGKLVKKPYIGNNRREIECYDIVKVNRLLYVTGGLCEVICLIVLGIIFILK